MKTKSVIFFSRAGNQLTSHSVEWLLFLCLHSSMWVRFWEACTHMPLAAGSTAVGTGTGFGAHLNLTEEHYTLLICK